jgi:hypothetical protein
MVALLAPSMGEKCLEPSAGKGAFIDGLLAAQPDLQVTAYELDGSAVEHLRERYTLAPNVDIREGDFLFAGEDLFGAAGDFDKVIGNPPYGAWQDYAKRTSLKSKFPGLYVRETYGVFLVQSIQRLRQGGRLVFIVPETFLYLHLQRGLRQLLLDTCSLTSLDVFPSSLFPGVRFGYARLCIVCLEHRRAVADHQIRIRHVSTVEELVSGNGSAIHVPQAEVRSRQDQVFPLLGHTAHARLIDGATTRLGDVADCVTGLYTGDDRRFLRRSKLNPRGIDRFEELDLAKLAHAGDAAARRDGLEGERCFLPILKGGGACYLKQELWYIDWSIRAVAHYKSDRKARFQNSRFYFRRGIGFPMVSSGRATASEIKQHWLFDQSVVAVFPKDDRLYGYLLAFLNSSLCWQLLREINPSANNSAKYLRKLPIILPDSDRIEWFRTAVDSYLLRLAAGESPDEKLEQQLDEQIAAVFESIGDGANAL